VISKSHGTIRSSYHKNKMMWFSTPCNPSGSVYDREELTALAKVLEKHPHVYVVADEIYEHINFSGNFCSIASIREC
jgi:aspartate aminotransferase